MIPNLPRQLLWTDKKDISEFLSDEFGNEIVSAFSFAKSRITVTLAPNTLLKLYNEAFYLSTRVVYEQDENARPDIYMAEILKDEIDEELAEHVILVMYMVLLLQSNKSKTILHFIDELQKEYLTDIPFLIAKWLHKGIVRIKKDVGYKLHKLHPRPTSAGELQKNPINWHELSQGFNKRVIVELLNLWESKNERGKIIGLIEFAFISSQNLPKGEEIADEVFFIQQKNLYCVINDENDNITKVRNLTTSFAEQLFTHNNSFVRNVVKTIVEKYYRDKAVNLALIEIVLCDHELIKNRENHTALVEILISWGALRDNLDVKLTANSMSQKINYINKKEGTTYKPYIEWSKCLRDKKKCISIGDDLSKKLEYSE